MGDKQNEDLENKNDVENSSQNKPKKGNTSKLLNTLLSLIVIITVGTGALIYYSLYKYSNEEDVVNIVENEVQEDVSTVADILDTALNTNTTEDSNNTVSGDAPTDTTTVRKYYYSNNWRS